MLSTTNQFEFDWDDGNITKSLKKHNIYPKESEEVFLDENALVFEDYKHSTKDEARFVIIGKTFDIELLFIVYTVRAYKVRIISARKANIRDKKMYYEK